MVPHLYSSLVEFMQTDLNAPMPGTNRLSPLALVADKATPNKSTLHIIGVVSILNGKLTPLVVDVIEATDNAGAGLVNDMVASAERFVPLESLRNRYNFLTIIF